MPRPPLPTKPRSGQVPHPIALSLVIEFEKIVEFSIQVYLHVEFLNIGFGLEKDLGGHEGEEGGLLFEH